MAIDAGKRVRKREYDTAARRRTLQKADEAWREGRAFVPTSSGDANWMRRHGRESDFKRIEPGVYVRQSAWNDLDVAQRELLTIRGLTEQGAVKGFWCFSAALVRGLEVPFPLLARRYLVCSNIPSTSCADVSIAKADRVGPLECVDGVHVTSFWRTVEDCLLKAPFGMGLAIADSALRLSGETAEQLEQRLARDAARRHGLRRALAVASYADGLSENGGESRFRAFFIMNGFEIPRLQVEFKDPLDQKRTYRVDYLWERKDGTMLIGELDGMDKYLEDTGDGSKVSVKAFADERQRESHLTMLGYPVLRFSFAELHNPEQLCSKLERAGVPRRIGWADAWSEQWNTSR